MTTVMEAVATAAASVAREYALNSVPPTPTYPYGVHSASLGRGDVYTLDASEGVRWGRIVHQSFGRTAESALAKTEEFRAALVGNVLAITGYSTTPVRAELDPQIVRDPDTAGVVGVTTTYTFTATKE
jgi:hypothetical protein